MPHSGLSGMTSGLPGFPRAHVLHDAGTRGGPSGYVAARQSPVCSREMQSVGSGDGGKSLKRFVTAC